MCSVDTYDKEHVPIPSDASSKGGIPMPIMSSKKAIYSLGHTINFIDNWIKWFDVNNQNRIAIYKIKMGELFQKIPKLLPS